MAKPAFRVAAEAEGLADAIRTLGKVDRELKKELVRSMKKAADPLVAEARSSSRAQNLSPTGTAGKAALSRTRSSVASKCHNATRRNATVKANGKKPSGCCQCSKQTLLAQSMTWQAKPVVMVQVLRVLHAAKP
jgi:hypothetical protein